MSELEHGSSSSLGGAQSPEEAAEALRLYGEQQHSHSGVLQNLEDGESDDDDSDEDLSIGVCSEEDLLASYARCRDEDTVKGYRYAVRAFIRWLIRVKDNYAVKDMVGKILKRSEDGEYKLDYGALAKSLEVPKNMYCHYTLSFQRDANRNNKSGLGHIKALRSGLSNEFLENRVEVSRLALHMLKNWTRSRKRDDMRARTRPNNPIKFSNARSSLPFPAYHKIAELMLILHPDPFLHCMFVFQWNMIARHASVRG